MKRQSCSPAWSSPPWNIRCTRGIRGACITSRRKSRNSAASHCGLCLAVLEGPDTISAARCTSQSASCSATIARVGSNPMSTSAATSLLSGLGRPLIHPHSVAIRRSISWINPHRQTRHAMLSSSVAVFYACVDVHMFVYAYVCFVCLCERARVHEYAYMHAFMCLCMCLCLCICMRVRERKEEKERERKRKREKSISAG